MPEEILPATSKTEKVDGVDRTFVFLNTYDRMEFTRAHRKASREKFLDNRKIAGVTGPQLVADLDDFDENPPDWTNWLNDDEGQIFAIKLSLKKTYKPDEIEPIIGSIDFGPTEMRTLMLALFGRFVSVRTPEPAPDPLATYGDPAAGADPNAKPPGLTYGTPAA